MKKILFMIINMNIGGTEKALINMLNKISEEDYKITVLMLEKKGGFLKYIPSNVQIKVLDEYDNIKWYFNEPPKKVVLTLLKKRKIIKSINIAMIYLYCKIFDDIEKYYKYIFNDIEFWQEEYDMAVAYAGPMNFITYFIANKIKANKKIQWIHFDISQIPFNKKFSSKLYKKFNKIFTVSKEGKMKIIKEIPELEEKTEKLLNIISPDLINKMAKEDLGFKDDFQGIKILTVGRLSKEKGQDITISVLSKLKKQGYNVKWYCIGEGPARQEYEKNILVNNLKNDYILLGSKVNPYPYMRECDIYVQPSRHEGYCITLAEARCFNNPIITTNFTGANEQIINQENGLIVNFDENEMYKGIIRLLNDKNLINKIKKNLKNENINTENEIKKFISILEN